MPDSVTITPSTGNAPFPTQGGVGAAPGFDAIDFRRFFSRMYREGVLDQGTAWSVNENSAGADLTLEVWADLAPALVRGDAVTDQGLYYVAPHSATVVLDVATPDATDPRVDRVVLEVLDDEHDSSGSTTSRARIIAGSPTAGATLDNRAGLPALPAGALALADVLVPAGATAVDNTNIRDYRVLGHRDADPGDITLSGASAAPLGWLPCDGRVLDRAQHERLFDAIGTTFGAGDGTTFAVPDLRGRVGVSPDGAAGRLAVNGALGNAGGAESVTLSAAQLPAHTHSLPLPTYEGNNGSISGPHLVPERNDTDRDTDWGQATGSTGSGSPVAVMQPFLVVNHFIYTGSAVG